MTPAIRALKKAKISYTSHAYAHDPNVSSYGLEAAEKLGFPPAQLFKTLLATVDGDALVVAIVPVAHHLDLKALAKAAGSKRAEMAELRRAETTTGYVAGGISPFGQKKRLPTFIDASAFDYDCIYVSGGRRGLDIGIAPHDLVHLTAAITAAIARD